jgi:YVTN family beta-propeller protein
VIEPSGRHAYITNIYGNDVSVIDLREGVVVARIDVGAEPNGVSFSSRLPSRAASTTQTVEVPERVGDMGDMDMEH